MRLANRSIVGTERTYTNNIKEIKYSLDPDYDFEINICSNKVSQNYEYCKLKRERQASGNFDATVISGLLIYCRVMFCEHNKIENCL